jgi:hypothetical protein
LLFENDALTYDEIRCDQSKFFHATSGKNNFLGSPAGLGSNSFHSLDNLAAVGDAAEDDMLSVKPAGVGSGDEELAAVGVGTSVGHRDAVGLVLQLEVLVLETISIDGFASSAVSSGEISTLDHEVRDDTVEGTALVSTYTVSLTEFDKVLHCLGNHFSEEIQYDVTCITATDVDAQSHSMSGYLLSRAIFTD